MFSVFFIGFRCLVFVVMTAVAVDIKTDWTTLIRIRNGRTADALGILQSSYDDHAKCPSTANQQYLFSGDYCTDTFVGSWLDVNLAEQVFLTLRNNKGEIMYYILFRKDPALSAPTNLSNWFETAMIMSSSFSGLGSEMNFTVQRHILGFAVLSEYFEDERKIKNLNVVLNLALQQIDSVWYNAITTEQDGTDVSISKDSDMCFADHLLNYNETDDDCENARSFSECHLCCVRDGDRHYAAIKLSERMDFNEFGICRCFNRDEKKVEEDAVKTVTNVAGSCNNFRDCKDHSLGSCVFFQRVETKYDIVRYILYGNNKGTLSKKKITYEPSKIRIEATSDITRLPLYASSVWFNMSSTPSTSCTWTVTYFPFDKCNQPDPYLVYNWNVTVPKPVGNTMEVIFGDVIRIGCLNLTSSCYNKNSIIYARLKGVSRRMVHAPILELIATQADIPPPDGYPPGTKNFTITSDISEQTTSEPEITTTSEPEITTTSEPEITTGEISTSHSNSDSSSSDATIFMTTENPDSSQTTKSVTETFLSDEYTGGGTSDDNTLPVTLSKPTVKSSSEEIKKDTTNSIDSKNQAGKASTDQTTMNTVRGESSPQNNSDFYNTQETATESSSETNKSWIPLSDDFIQLQLAADTFVCKNVTIIVHNVTSIAELEEELTRLTKNLTVEKSSLSATIRRKSSAKDDRTSATSIGMIGIIILSCEFGFFIFLDFTYLVDAAVKLKNNLRPKE